MRMKTEYNKYKHAVPSHFKNKLMQEIAPKTNNALENSMQAHEETKERLTDANTQLKILHEKIAGQESVMSAYETH